jgi:hypothetical protein
MEDTWWPRRVSRVPPRLVAGVPADADGRRAIAIAAEPAQESNEDGVWRAWTSGVVVQVEVLDRQTNKREGDRAAGLVRVDANDQGAPLGWGFGLAVGSWLGLTGGCRRTKCRD